MEEQAHVLLVDVGRHQRGDHPGRHTQARVQLPGGEVQRVSAEQTRPLLLVQPTSSGRFGGLSSPMRGTVSTGRDGSTTLAALQASPERIASQRCRACIVIARRRRPPKRSRVREPSGGVSPRVSPRGEARREDADPVLEQVGGGAHTAARSLRCSFVPGDSARAPGASLCAEWRARGCEASLVSGRCCQPSDAPALGSFQFCDACV